MQPGQHQHPSRGRSLDAASDRGGPPPAIAPLAENRAWPCVRPRRAAVWSSWPLTSLKLNAPPAQAVAVSNGAALAAIGQDVGRGALLDGWAAGVQTVGLVTSPRGDTAELDGRTRTTPDRRISAPARSAGKRLLDMMVAAFALTLFLPLLLVIAAAVRLETRGPALFRQRRTGLGGQVFTIYKFRTMTVAEDDAQVRQCVRNDARVTPLGGLLRQLSLDELPQLINVLLGDMSLVGPRPHAVAHDRHFAGLVPTYDQRFRARPGLTGFAQVSGLRGEIRDLRCMMDRVSADNLYIDEWSLWMDVAILLATVPLIFGDPRAY